jgi:hypothetical protein
MRVRRTGAKKGESVTWYVQAEGEEKELIRQGFWEEQAPNKKYIYVLQWGFDSKSDAEAAMERLEPRVEELLAKFNVGNDDSSVERSVEREIVLEEVASTVESLQATSKKLQDVAEQLYDVRLNQLVATMKSDVGILTRALEELFPGE